MAIRTSPISNGTKCPGFTPGHDTVHETFGSILVERAVATHPGLLYEDQQWSWEELVAEAAVRSDTAYNAMPLFHGNALMASFAPAAYVGCTIDMRRNTQNRDTQLAP